MRRALCAEMRSGNGVYFRENLSVLPIEILNCYIRYSDLLGGTFWAYLNIGGDLYPPMYMDGVDSARLLVLPPRTGL